VTSLTTIVADTTAFAAALAPTLPSFSPAPTVASDVAEATAGVALDVVTTPSRCSWAISCKVTELAAGVALDVASTSLSSTTSLGSTRGGLVRAISGNVPQATTGVALDITIVTGTIAGIVPEATTDMTFDVSVPASATAFDASLGASLAILATLAAFGLHVPDFATDGACLVQMGTIPDDVIHIPASVAFGVREAVASYVPCFPTVVTCLVVPTLCVW